MKIIKVTTRSPAKPLYIALIILTILVSNLYALSIHAQETISAEDGKLINVGLQRSIKTLSEASKIAANGDTVEVDAGDYLRDVAVWTQNNLTLKAINGRVRLIGGGASAEDKAIWVIRGGRIQIEGFDFIGAAVRNRNGAGIRFEKGHLAIRNCTFMKNENGILTGANAESTLEIENSEFGFNGFGDGQSHNLYVGAISRLSVKGSYFHHAKVGHLLKSRAAENRIYYNRLTDETGGTASYELEFPNAGIAYVVGNIIQQSSTTENPIMVSYGAEGNHWPVNTLYLVNNTLVDNRSQNGVFLRMKPGAGSVVALNNLLAGQGNLEESEPGDYRNNFKVDWDEFVLSAREDYHLRAGSKLKGTAIEPPTLPNVSLKQGKEYQHPRTVRNIPDGPLSPGAYQTTPAF